MNNLGFSDRSIEQTIPIKAQGMDPPRKKCQCPTQVLKNLSGAIMKASHGAKQARKDLMGIQYRI